MRRVRWSTRADREFKQYLALLMNVDPVLADEARREVDAALDLLTRHPGVGRQSLRWQAYREMSLTRWNKIAVYGVTDEFIRVHAFLDTRQDLDRVLL